MNFQIRVLLVRASGLPLLAVAELLERGVALTTHVISTARSERLTEKLSPHDVEAMDREIWRSHQRYQVRHSDAGGQRVGGASGLPLARQPPPDPGKQRGWPAPPGTRSGFDLPIC